MKDITQFKSSGQYTSALHIQEVCRGASIPQALSQQVAELCKTGVATAHKIYFRSTDVQRYSDVNSYKNIYPAVENALYNALVDISGIYNTIAPFENIPNMTDHSRTVENICKYFETNHYLLADNTKLDFETILKRQIILQTIRDGQVNHTDFMSILHNYINILGIDNDVILFYPTNTGHCVFDIFTLTPQTHEAFVNKLGRNTFINYLTTRTIMNNIQHEHTIPLLRYFHMLNYCVETNVFTAITAITAQSIEKIVNTYIENSELEGIELNQVEHRVLADLIITLKYDEKILAKLQPLITETTLAMILDGRNCTSIAHALQTFSKLKNLNFPVDNMLFVLNIAPTANMMTEIDNIMALPDTPEYNILTRLKNDPISVAMSLDDKYSKYIVNILHEKDFIAQYGKYITDNFNTEHPIPEKMNHYINIGTGDEIYTLKKIDMFTSQLLSNYIKCIIACNDAEGLDILKENLDGIIEIDWDIDDRITIGYMLSLLDAGPSYYNKFLENDIFIQEINNIKWTPMCCMFEKMMCDKLTFKSKVIIHLIKLFSDAANNVTNGSIVENTEDPSLEKSDYKKVARYYFNLTRLSDNNTNNISDISDLNKLSDVIELIGKYMTRNIADRLMAHSYDTFVKLVQYIPASKTTLLAGLDKYIKCDICHHLHDCDNTSFKIVNKLIETNLLEKNDIATYIDNIMISYNQTKIHDSVAIQHIYFVMCTMHKIEYRTTLIDIFKYLISHPKHDDFGIFCIVELSKIMNVSDIVSVMRGVCAQVMKNYCTWVNKIQDKHIVHNIYLNILTINPAGYSVFKSNGPLSIVCDLDTGFIDEMFATESKSDNYCGLVDNCIKKYLQVMCDPYIHSDAIIPFVRFLKMFESLQFSKKVVDTMRSRFTDDPVATQPWYNYIMSYFVVRDPEFFGKSNMFHTEYWNYMNGSNKNIHNFFHDITSALSTANYSNITLALNKLEFISIYIEAHGIPCEYSDVKEAIYKIITKFITNDDIMLYVLGIIEKFNGICDLVKDKCILEELVKNITMYKFLLETLSRDNQAELLSHNTKISNDLIMKYDLLFFIELADQLSISYTIDINNTHTLNQLLELDITKIYALFKNGFIECDFITLVKKINNILDIDDLLLSDEDVNIVCDMENDSLVLAKILKNLKKNKSPLYLTLVHKKIKYYIDSDPLGLSEFITHTGCSVFNTQLDDTLLQKIYNLCAYDHVLYEILFKSTDDIDRTLINIKTCGGNMMLSCFVNNGTIMKKGLPEISFDRLFEKNRFGRYVIENLLTPYTINIFKDRLDGAEIINNINKYNINGTRKESGIDNLLETSKTSSNNFMFMCKTLTSSDMSDLTTGLSPEDINRLMASTDDKLNNGLFYITRYHPTILENYIDIVDNTIFESVNLFGETLGMYAMRYNADSYTILENADKITKDHNYIDIHSGSLLSYAVKYNSSLVEHIINAPYFNEYSLYVKDSVDMIDFENQDMPRIKICVNLTNIIVALDDIDTFQSLVQLFPAVFNTHINEKFTISSTDYNTLRYALCINPEIASIIIGSVMCTDKYIETFCSYFPENDFSMIANIQPSSWYKIINSSKFKNIKPTQSDNYHYSKKTNLGYIVEHATDKNKKLIQYKQSFDFTQKTVCNICCCAKAVILHSKCGHKMCVGCSLIENTCPMCNINSSPDNQYYID